MAGVDYVWTDNTSGNTNWNDQLNWNDGASGYPDDSDDTATFNGTWTSNCTANVAVKIGKITLDTGYTGKVTQTANLETDSVSGDEDGSLTITAGELDISTYDCDINGATDVTDTLTIGATASNGLTTDSFNVNSGASIYLQLTSKINTGDYIIVNEAVFVTNYRGILTLNASGNVNSPSASNRIDGLYQLAGVTSTLTNHFSIADLNTNNVSILGTFAVIGGYQLTVGSNTTFTIGANADITGGANILFVINDTSTLTVNKTSTFSFTGELRHYLPNIDIHLIYGDWSNADLTVVSSPSRTTTRKASFSGNLKIKDFIVEININYNVEIDNTLDKNIEWSGNVNLNSGTGTYTTTWIKGATATITGTGSSGIQTWALDSQTMEDIILNCSGATKQLTEHAGTVDDIIITAGILDMQTFNLESLGLTDVSGTLKIGVSADTGLTTVGLTLNSGATADYQSGSKINNAGNYSCDDSSIFTNNYRGIYTQTENGNFESASLDNKWYEFIVDANKTCTFAGAGINRVTAWFSNKTEINGTIAINVSSVEMGCSATGSFILGTNCDITASSSSNQWTIFITSGATLTNNKVGTFTFNGVHRNYMIDDQIGMTGDWSNAEYQMYGIAIANTLTLQAGTLKCKKLTITSNQNEALGWDNSANSPSIEVSDSIDLHAGTGAYVLTWSRGTATITGTGTSGTHTWDFNGQNIEKIILNCSGATKQLLTSIPDTDALTITAGIFDMQTYSLSTAGEVDVYGTLKMGSGASITTAGFHLNGTSTFDAQTDSTITNNGDFRILSGCTFTNLNRGTFIQNSDTSTFEMATNLFFHKFTLNAGVTVTQSGRADLTAAASGGGTIINGIIDKNGYLTVIGSSAAGEMTFGANSNIIGSNTLTFAIHNNSTLNLNKTTTFGLTGTVRSSGSPDRIMPAMNFSNITTYQMFLSVSGTLYLSAGTLIVNGAFNLKCDSGIGVYNASTHNPNFQLNGDIDFNYGASSHVWQKGTSTISLFGSSGTQTLTWNGQDVEDIVVNCSGATKQCTDALHTDKITMQAGILELKNGVQSETDYFEGTGGSIRSDSDGNQAELKLNNDAQYADVDSVAFRDIGGDDTSGYSRINAKNNCTNEGNNDLWFIVFVDKTSLLI